ncbi:ribosome maturation factor RimM [Nocardioides marmorisolisilvae]|uniref:Ribosome maturation factor RimM n=1 Tax=Nocardioides marmorisolisilvae TaxID=1542737 RepID=A0A3N0DW48_9ACTN|nr:ribosome maturation factor RimM [Nocardioides marmorisolisilvae]RNL79850.1 ribosome maturation factor RimM [Nocardioides marmorisolisilvae]
MTETVVVGRIGKPHGVKGEVSVEPRTDEPDRRFAAGQQLKTENKRPGAAGPSHLTVAGTRWHSGRLLVRFEEIADRNAAEEARGTLLAIPLDPEERPEDPEEFYDHQLVGLAVVTTDGRTVGALKEIVHGSAQDLLVIATEGREVLVPFVSALVPEVDLAGRRIVVEDRPGLLSELPDEGTD